MKCPKCAAEVHLSDKFCKSCGESLPEDAEAPRKEGESTTADRLKDAQVQAREHVEEKDIWEGRYSVLEAGGWWILSGFLLLAVLVFYIGDIAGLRENWFLVTGVIVSGLIFLVSLFYSFNKHLTNKYKVTTQRVFYIQGFLSRTTDELEIIRVDDVQYKQTLAERIFNLGTVVVIAPTDRTHGDKKDKEGKSAQAGQLVLLGVKHPEEVKEQIRKHCRLRRDKDTLFVEQV